MFKKIVGDLGGEIQGKVLGIPIDSLVKLLALDALGPVIAAHETIKGGHEALELAHLYYALDGQLNDPPG